MKNYKINKGRPPLSEEDFVRGKDFNQVLKGYRAIKTPIIKLPKFWFSASAVMVACVIGLLIYDEIETTELQNPKASFINPPIAAANIKSDHYILNAEKDSVLHYPGGTLIHVPANAFLDKDGKVVKGNVDLSYREFKKIADVFLAGIPMTYDSAGVQYNFETAGMLDISASKDGESLRPNPEAIITVDMTSNNKEDRFNTYYLDTVQKKWKYVAESNFNAPQKPSAGSISGDVTTTTTTLPVTALPKAEKPVEPKKVDKSKPAFSISVEEKEFPEIAVYKNVKFQVQDKNYDPAKANTVWENVSLKRVPNSRLYQITFMSAKENYTVIAEPVFDDKDYAAAKNVYDAKYAQYEDKLVKRQTEEARVKTEKAAQAKQMAQKFIQDSINEVALQKEYEERFAQTAMVTRTFQIHSFGIWNSDAPCRMPKGANVMASLIDSKTKKEIVFQDCYLVEKDRNAMFIYHPGSLNSFVFDPTKENMIWVITADCKIAVLKPEQFRAAKKSGNAMQFELTVIDQEFTSDKEVKEYLEI